MRLMLKLGRYQNREAYLKKEGDPNFEAGVARNGGCYRTRRLRQRIGGYHNHEVDVEDKGDIRTLCNGTVVISHGKYPS